MLKFPSFVEWVSFRVPFVVFLKFGFKLLRVMFKRIGKLNVFFRRLEVSLYTFDSLNNSGINPEIDILILVAPKDLKLLNHVIQGGLYSSKNTVRKVHIVTPNISEVNQALNGICSNKIFVYKDSEILDELLTQFIEEKCGRRSGWVKQQLITNFFITNRAEIPTLNIDSDTILTKPRKWVDLDLTQILTPTWEYNVGYYKFLANLNSKLYCNIELSFVPHHMLFIPEVFKTINRLNDLSHVNLFKIINDYLSQGNVNDFDFKYDYYAQAYNKLELKFNFEKWSNLSIPRDTLIDLLRGVKSKEDFEFFARSINYASVSGHEWNRSND
jgi:hypothetical protein